MTWRLPFWYLLYPGVREGVTPFPGLLHFTLDTYFILLSVKQGGIKYHFLSLWYDSTWDWTQHFNHHANNEVYRNFQKLKKMWVNCNLNYSVSFNIIKLKVNSEIIPCYCNHLLKFNYHKMLTVKSINDLDSPGKLFRKYLTDFSSSHYMTKLFYSGEPSTNWDSFMARPKKNTWFCQQSFLGYLRHQEINSTLYCRYSLWEGSLRLLTTHILGNVPG